MKNNFIIVVLSMIFILFFQNTVIAKSLPYSIVQDPNGVYVVQINTIKAKNNIMPFAVDGLETNYDVFKYLGAKLVVNAGFFDPKNKKTVSYVVINNELILDPTKNENLMSNESLKPYMDKILNRSEFRILENDKGHLIYDIALHNSEAIDGYKIKHSIQAGPMLLPNLQLEDEFFIVKKDGKIVTESASSLHKYARTAIGIKEDYIYLFIVTNENPMNLMELRDLTKKWGMEKAMAFDGGGSTSFDVQELHIVSEKDNQARKLKSFLIIK